MSDRIAGAFNRSGAACTVALDISKAFDRVWHAGLRQKLKSYGISGEIFGLISCFLSNRRLRVVLDGKSSQEYPVYSVYPVYPVFSVTIRRCYKHVYVNSFFHRTARPWNFLPIECFPLNYDLSSFKSRIKRHLLTVGSF